MPRIAKQDFRLLMAGMQEPVQYRAGDIIEKEHEEHWYAKAHSEEQKQLSKKQLQALAAAEKAVTDAEAAYSQAAAASEAQPENEQLLEAAIEAQQTLEAARTALAALQGKE